MSEIKDGFVVVDEVQLEYRRIGIVGGNSPTLVLLHEGLGSVAMWKDFPEQLAEITGLSVFSYSRQSYGKSSTLPLARDANYLHREAIDILPKVLELAGIEQPIFVGHSDGASIAIIYAGSALLPRPAVLILMAAHVFNEKISVKGISAAKQAYEQSDLRERLSTYHDEVDNAFWRWNDIWLDESFKDWNIEQYLSNISVPVLHIQGENDEYGTAGQIEAIQAQCAGEVEVLRLDNCGHSPFRDQLQASLNAMGNFIESHGLSAH